MIANRSAAADADHGTSAAEAILDLTFKKKHCRRGSTTLLILNVIQADGPFVPLSDIETYAVCLDITEG